MLRTAKQEDFPALAAMWQSCFGDSAEAAGFIFSKLQRPENILVYTDKKEKIVSMLSLRSFLLASPVSRREAMYIYGVATAPDERGKGYSTALLDDAHAFMAERGAVCSVLVPADAGLAEFYGKRGYEAGFNINKVVIRSNDIIPADAPETNPALPLTPKRFAELRDAYFGDSRMFVRFGEEYLSYIIEESAFYGGGAFEFTVEGKPCFAVCYRDGGNVTVKELAAAKDTVDGAIAAIRAKFPAGRYVFYLREDVQTSYTNNLLPFGMLKWYDNSVKNELGDGAPAYLTHALD